MSDAKMFTIVVASGTSQRFGSNKLLEKIGDETVLDRSVRIALENSDGVVVVIEPSSYQNSLVTAVVAGGTTRTQSVRNGLKAVPADVEIIAVHDAARPGATQELYERGKSVILEGNVAAVPGIPVVDTIKKIEKDRAIFTVDRSTLRSIQTPQVFNAKTLRKAYEGQTDDTDDAALVEAMGVHVKIFEGTTQNRKITTPEDLVFLRAVLTPTESIRLLPRIGSGYDIHPFGDDKNKKLVLGGVEIDHQGLQGHSDSDALSHGLTDALLSAIGAPDLGTLFPASDENNKDVSSLVFLEKAVTLVYNEGYNLGNATLIINAQNPKLAPFVDEMKKCLTEILDPIIDSQSQVTITPKHGEGIGEIGAGQAIAVYATVLLVPVAK